MLNFVTWNKIKSCCIFYHIPYKRLRFLNNMNKMFFSFEFLKYTYPFMSVISFNWKNERENYFHLTLLVTKLIFQMFFHCLLTDLIHEVIWSNYRGADKIFTVSKFNKWFLKCLSMIFILKIMFHIENFQKILEGQSVSK